MPRWYQKLSASLKGSLIQTASEMTVLIHQHGCNEICQCCPCTKHYLQKQMCSSDSVYYCLSLPHLQNQRVIKGEKSLATESCSGGCMQLGPGQKHCLEPVFVIIIIIIKFQRPPPKYFKIFKRNPINQDSWTFLLLHCLDSHRSQNILN